MFRVYFRQWWWSPYWQVSDTHFPKSLIEFYALFKESCLKTAVIFSSRVKFLLSLVNPCRFAMRSRSWGKAAGRGEPGRELLSSISLSTEAAIMRWKHCFLLVFYFSCKPGANTKKKYLRCHFLDRLFIATGFFRVVLLVDSSSSWQTKAYPACSDVIVMVFTISYFKAVL